MSATNVVSIYYAIGAGDTQTTASQVSASANVILASGAAGTGIMVPPAVTGTQIIFQGPADYTQIFLYPRVGFNIGNGVNIPYSLNDATGVVLLCTDGLNWTQLDFGQP